MDQFLDPVKRRMADWRNLSAKLDSEEPPSNPETKTPVTNSTLNGGAWNQLMQYIPSRRSSTPMLPLHNKSIQRKNVGPKVAGTSTNTNPNSNTEPEPGQTSNSPIYVSKEKALKLENEEKELVPLMKEHDSYSSNFTASVTAYAAIIITQAGILLAAKGAYAAGLSSFMLWVLGFTWVLAHSGYTYLYWSRVVTMKGFMLVSVTRGFDAIRRRLQSLDVEDKEDDSSGVSEVTEEEYEKRLSIAKNYSKAPSDIEWRIFVAINLAIVVSMLVLVFRTWFHGLLVVVVHLFRSL